MATLLERAQLAADADFRLKVSVCLVKIALQISGEAPGTMTQSQLEKRSQLAARIIAAPESIAAYAALTLTAPGTIESDTYTDGDLEYLVTSIFDDLAGVTSSDLSE